MIGVEGRGVVVTTIIRLADRRGIGAPEFSFIAAAAVAALATAFVLLPSPAAAMCSDNTPDTGDVVTCVPPTDTTGVAAMAGSTNVTVTVNAGATVDVSTSMTDAIVIRDASAIVNNGTVNAGGALAHALAARGDGNTITNNGTADTDGSGASGMFADGSGNELINNGTLGANGAAAGAAMQVSGDSNMLTNAAGGTINNTTDFRDGLAATGNDNDVVNLGTITTTGTDGDGINVDGDMNRITHSGTMTIGGTSVNGVQVSGAMNTVDVLGDVTLDNPALSLSVGAAVSIFGDDNIIMTDAVLSSTDTGVFLTGDRNTLMMDDMLGASGIGVVVTGSNNEVTNDAAVMTGGAGLISNFGGGMNTFTNNGSVATTGMFAHAVRVDSSAGNTIVNNSMLSTEGFFARGISALSADNEITNHGTIVTTGDLSDGIYTGFDGNTVANYGRVEVSGAGAHAMNFDSFPLEFGRLTNGVDGMLISAQGLGVRGVDGPEFIENFGTIVSSVGTAVDLGAADDEFLIGATSSITGTVDGGGDTDTFVLGGDADGAFDLGDIGPTAQFRNFEAFEKRGASTWTATGMATGDWDVLGGTFLVNGVIDGAVAAADGATLGGAGTVGATTIAGGGIHAPGTSIGVQTVNGAYVLDPGAVRQIEIDDAENSDLVDVTGTVTIDNAVLDIQVLPGTYDLPEFTYLIIDNDDVDAVAGAGFATIMNPLAFYDAAVATDGGDGNDVVLSLTRNATVFADIARTPNQRSVAMALPDLDQSPGSDGETVIANILGLTEPEARDAFDKLSGEIHPTAGVLALSDLGRMVDVIREDEPRTAAGSRLSYRDPLRADAPAFWLRALGGVDNVDGDGNAHDADHASAGVAVGLEKPIGDTLTIGLAAGYSWGSVDVGSVHSSIDIDTFAIAALGRWRDGMFEADVAAGYAYQHFDSGRGIEFGDLARTATADYGGDAPFVSVEARLVEMVGDVAVKPFVGVDALWLDTNGFEETGAGSVNLINDGESFESVLFHLGIEATTEVMVGDVRLMPRGRIGWAHEFGDDKAVNGFVFAGGPTATTIAGTGRGRDRAEIEAALAADIAEDLSAFIAYQGSLASNGESHGARAGITLVW